MGNKSIIDGIYKNNISNIIDIIMITCTFISLKRLIFWSIQLKNQTHEDSKFALNKSHAGNLNDYHG